MQTDRRQFLQAASLLTGAAALGQSPPVLAQSTVAQPSDAALEAKAPPLPALGTRLVVPEVPLLDGSVFRPAQAEAQVLVVYWWASTCPFCALQSPEMQKLWNAHRGRMQLLTLSIDRKPEPAIAYLKKHGYTFPAGWVTPALRQALPKPKGLPITLVRGRDGAIVQAERGQLFPEDVEQLAQHWQG